ncbi:uncharacterized protein LDX57_004798 [Aspergillus melleus]|uniref:uncharacterized protein n=1 Tax=Aspergillus melleus TaxID=138277 RepID=UPI001E8D06E2|nr:uncharacterized protein LDX57_004798 [Aspergillus melleus]KAH8427080.1 hypothetical protein LDX57_004798 [Aspergillus melleus]
MASAIGTCANCGKQASSLPGSSRTRYWRYEQHLLLHQSLSNRALARDRFASFANGVNKDLLGGSSTEFEDKLKAFKTELKLHMCFGV